MVLGPTLLLEERHGVLNTSRLCGSRRFHGTATASHGLTPFASLPGHRPRRQPWSQSVALTVYSSPTLLLEERHVVLGATLLLEERHGVLNTSRLCGSLRSNLSSSQSSSLGTKRLCWEFPWLSHGLNPFVVRPRHSRARTA